MLPEYANGSLTSLCVNADINRCSLLISARSGNAGMAHFQPNCVEQTPSCSSGLKENMNEGTSYNSQIETFYSDFLMYA